MSVNNINYDYSKPFSSSSRLAVHGCNPRIVFACISEVSTPLTFVVSKRSPIQCSYIKSKTNSDDKGREEIQKNYLWLGNRVQMLFIYLGFWVKYSARTGPNAIFAFHRILINMADVRCGKLPKYDLCVFIYLFIFTGLLWYHISLISLNTTVYIYEKNATFSTSTHFFFYLDFKLINLIF